MKGIGAVTGREIIEKRMALLVAAVAGLIPILAPILFAASFRSQEARGMLVLCGMFSFSAGAAIVFGSSTLAREMKERRLSFFFSRPLAPAAIWGGKLLAAFLLSLAIAALCALPAVLVFGIQGAHAGLTLTLIALTLVFLVALSDVISSALRSRSPWIVIDFVLLVIVTAALVWVARKLFVEGWWGFGTPTPVLAALAAGVPLVTLLAASYARVAMGRTDIRRAHGAQSVVLWGLALPTTATLAAFTLWLSSPTPADLMTTTARHAAPAGNWEAVRGPLRHRGQLSMTFLVNSRSGTYLSLPDVHHVPAIRFSGDGSRAAWIGDFGRPPGHGSGEASYEIVVGELDKTPPVVHRTGLAGHGPWPVLSHHGMRLATLDGPFLAVYDVAHPELPKSEVTVRLPLDRFPLVSFAGDDVVVVAPTVEMSKNSKYAERDEIPTYRFDIPSKALSRSPPARVP